MMDIARLKIITPRAIKTTGKFHLCKLVILVAFSFFLYLAALCAFCQLAV
jgi:hypothetical protein